VSQMSEALQPGRQAGTVGAADIKGRTPKRVVFFHDSHGYGGMELYLLRLIRHLDRDRYLPAVLIPGYTERYFTSSPQFIDEVRAAGIPLLKPPDPGRRAGYRAIKELATTAQVLRSFEADIVHIHTCRSEGAQKVTLSARLAGVSGVIRTEHFPPAVTFRPASRYLVKPFDYLTDYIVTGSQGDCQGQIDLLKRNPAKVQLSYNSVELELFDPEHDVRAAKERLGLNPDVPVVMTVGRLALQKGHRYLLEAHASVLEQYGPVNLVLVGDGELLAELEAQAKQLGSAPHVHFAGFQSDVIPYMQAADIATMPSLFEVFSLSMLEFMALGKPVVASDHSSFLEAFSDGVNGLIVPMKDSQRLAEAILRLLQDEQLRYTIGRAGLERVRENFSFQRLADDMMNLYDRVIGGGKGGRAAQAC
jgi:glycosyltransferase involved in cell wall biosynthesis